MAIIKPSRIPLFSAKAEPWENIGPDQWVNVGHNRQVRLQTTHDPASKLTGKLKGQSIWRVECRLHETILLCIQLPDPERWASLTPPLLELETHVPDRWRSQTTANALADFLTAAVASQSSNQYSYGRACVSFAEDKVDIFHPHMSWHRIRPDVLTISASYEVGFGALWDSMRLPSDQSGVPYAWLRKLAYERGRSVHWSELPSDMIGPTSGEAPDDQADDGQGEVPRLLIRNS